MTQLTKAEMEAKLAALQAENATLKSNGSNHAISFKVGDKGGVSVYGLGRFPVTLYKEQWENLLAHSDDIRAFIAANAGRLKTK